MFEGPALCWAFLIPRLLTVRFRNMRGAPPHDEASLRAAPPQRRPRPLDSIATPLRLRAQRTDARPRAVFRLFDNSVAKTKTRPRAAVGPYVVVCPYVMG